MKWAIFYTFLALILVVVGYFKQEQIEVERK